MSEQELFELHVITGIDNEKLYRLSHSCKTYKSDDIRIIDIYDDEYPFLLKQTYGCPIILYMIGRIPSEPCISIVGSRIHTDYGERMAYELSSYLSQKGYCIVSGMAKGIDAICHKGALKYGSTIAVLGNGPDICYPKENSDIYRLIKEKGAVLSEYPPSMMPLKYHFPQRNRIISGLSSITVVIEANSKSGSLITANYALSQNRDVYVFPNYIDTGYNGTNLLIKDGAGIITDMMEFYEEIKCIEI
jgi:DNA processing protein